MALSFDKVDFSIDLVESVEKEISFLKRVDDLQYLYNPKIIKEAVRRYELLWLPMVVKFNGVIAAPIDIYWVWHVHMLSPASYRFDLNSTYRKVIDHQFLDKKSYESAIKEIRNLWTLKYPSEPFNFTSAERSVKFVSKFSCNLVDATCRQISFYYQVSLPHFKSKCFLMKCKERYKMFLSLKRRYPNKYIVPCYDIDIMWHTHRVHPISYSNDCTKLFGSIFFQDDWINDNDWNAKLISIENLTMNLWRKSFHDSFSNSGSMYRGKDSKGKLSNMSERSLSKFVPRILNIDIDIITEEIEMNKYTLKVYLCSADKEEWVFSYCYSKKLCLKQDIVNFHTDKHTGFRLKLFKKQGLIKKMRWESVAFLLEKFENFFQIGSAIILPLDISTKTRIFNDNKVRFTLKSYIYNDFHGCVTVGEFLTVSYNRQNKKSLSVIPFPICEQETSVGLIATHSVDMKYDCGKHAFDVNIIHIMSLNQSIVEVYCEKKMCAMAHLVNKEQLPNRLQVEDFIKYPTINNSDADSAMIIKDNKGDWMIIVPRWLDTKIDKTDARNNRSIHGFDLRIYHLRENKEYIFRKIEGSKCISFEIDGLSVDMTNGTIFLQPQTDFATIPNYVCLAFAVSVLFVLCNPKLNWKLEPEITSMDEDTEAMHYQRLRSMSIDSTVEIQGLPTATLGNSKTKYDEYQMLLACGHLYDPFLPNGHRNNTAALRSKYILNKHDFNISTDTNDPDVNDTEINILDMDNEESNELNVFSVDVGNPHENNQGTNYTESQNFYVNDTDLDSVDGDGQTKKSLTNQV